MSLSVECGRCPINGRMTYALYSRGLPVVAATIFLRHLQADIGVAENTLATYTYALKIFFGFLESSGLSFWEISTATIEQYKRVHLLRADNKGTSVLNRKTARQYLMVVKRLVGYWRGFKENDPLFLDHAAESNGTQRQRNSRGALAHMSWLSRVPRKLWVISIPKNEKTNKRRYKGLLTAEVQSVTRFLESVPHHTDVQRMLYYRDKAIWKFLLMSLVRKGELVRVRLEDLDFARGVISLVDRPSDAWLGGLKSGPDDIFVTAGNPCWSTVKSWLLHGRPIAMRLPKRRELDDHGMLFCNRDGGPLTQAAVENLFDKIKAACPARPGVSIHPHATRHTMASFMLERGLPLTEVQRLLRHESIQSTQIYARISDPVHRQALIAFWQSWTVVP